MWLKSVSQAGKFDTSLRGGHTAAACANKRVFGGHRLGANRAPAANEAGRGNLQRPKGSRAYALCSANVRIWQSTRILSTSHDSSGNSLTAKPARLKIANCEGDPHRKGHRACTLLQGNSAAQMRRIKDGVLRSNYGIQSQTVFQKSKGQTAAN